MEDSDSCSSGDTLAHLAARATTLVERFNSGWTPAESQTDGSSRDDGARARGDAILSQWKQLAAGDDDALWRDRLTLLGCTEFEARARLAHDGRRRDAGQPEWIETWRAFRTAFAERSRATKRRPGSADDAMIEVFADIGERQLVAEASRADVPIPNAVLAAFRHLVAARLRIIMAPVVAFERNTFLAAAGAASDWMGEDAIDPDTAFTREWTANGAALMERSYPMLARLACEQLHHYRAAWLELAARLQADSGGLAERFHPSRRRAGEAHRSAHGVGLGEVVSCRGGLSDPHQGARTAVELRFESGVRLVYKPRSLALEAGYFSLLQWLHGCGAGPVQKCPVVWDRRDYGWMEWIEAAPCQDPPAARRHFRRTGAHLAVLQLLGGADFHAENWIAAGEYPVPVDLEVLLRPSAPRARGDAAPLEESVLGVGLLPVWQTAGTKVANISALGDARHDAGDPDSGGHRVRIDQHVVAPADFADDIVAGFKRMHARLRRHRAAVVARNGPVASLRRGRSRHVARPTEVYARIQRSLTQPAALADGISFGLRLERAMNALAGAVPAERRLLGAMVNAEIAALTRLDVPLFHTRVGGVALETGEGPPIPRFFAVSGWTSAWRRLLALTPAATRQEAELIRAAFAVARLRADGMSRAQRRPQPLRDDHNRRGARMHREVTPTGPGGRARRSGAVRPSHSVGCGQPSPRRAGPTDFPAVDRRLDTRQLRREAITIGNLLAGLAIRTDDGISWIGPQVLARTERYQLAPLGPTLYDGRTGVALFLAALHHATGEPRWATLALGVFEPLVASIAQPERRRRLLQLPAGIGLGRAGVVYAISRASRWLARPEWLQILHRATLLEPQPHDHEHDVLSGAAGAVLGALQLGAIAEDRTAVELAAHWGARLSRGQHAMPQGGRAWTSDGVALGGFAHGAAGAAMALALLSAATGNHDFRTAAEDAVRYERTLLTRRGNWLDLRVPGAAANGVCALAWCHGAPGVLLARLLGLSGLDAEDVRHDIATALATTRTASAAEIDQCCCGEAGLIDILLVASAALNEPDLATDAHIRAAALFAKAHAAGGFNAFGTTALPAGPGFFQGLSGIGYLALRLTDPGRFPSVLAFA